MTRAWGGSSVTLTRLALPFLAIVAGSACNAVIGTVQDRPVRDGSVDSSSDTDTGTGPLPGAEGGTEASMGDGSGSIPGMDAESIDAGDSGEPDSGSAGDSAPKCTSICTLGASECASGGVQTCELEDGCAQWVTTTACGPNQTCVSSAGVASCSCISTICTEAGAVCRDAQTVATCATDANSCLYVASTAPCTSPRSCTGAAPGATCSLICSDTCTQGQTSCAAGGRATCTLDSNGCWAFGPAVACPSSNQSCTGPVGTTACTCNSSVCPSTASFCAGGSEQQNCAKDSQGCFYGSGVVACPYVCKGGACTGSCVPNETPRCDGNTVQTCDATGTWVNGQACQYTCNGGACTACMPGSTQCCDTTLGDCGANEYSTTWVSANVGGVTTVTPADALETQICNTQGQWATAATCSTSGQSEPANSCAGAGAGGQNYSQTDQIFKCAMCAGIAACEVNDPSLSSACKCP